jgi:hypothetical protein
MAADMAVEVTGMAVVAGMAAAETGTALVGMAVVVIGTGVQAAGMAVVVIGTALAGTVGVAAGIMAVTAAVGALDPR